MPLRKLKFVYSFFFVNNENTFIVLALKREFFKNSIKSIFFFKIGFRILFTYKQLLI